MKIALRLLDLVDGTLEQLFYECIWNCQCAIHNLLEVNDSDHLFLELMKQADFINKFVRYLSSESIYLYPPALKLAGTITASDAEVFIDQLMGRDDFLHGLDNQLNVK